MTKKGCILTLVLSLLIVVLTSCYHANFCEHVYTEWQTVNEATCKSSGYHTHTCKNCGKIETENISPLDHTTKAGTCARCGESIGIWHANYYVDEFKNLTDIAYITTAVNGTFCNTAATDAALTSNLIVDADVFSIKLYEYGSHEVKSVDYTSYAIAFLDTEGTKHHIHGLMQKNGDRIEISGDNKKELQKAFLKQGEIRFYIEETNRQTTNYLFSVETSNFAELYDAMWEQIEDKIEYIEENPAILRIGICPLPEKDNPYVNELGGMIYGFDVDYIKKIAYYLGYSDEKILFSVDTFDELFYGLDFDKYDIIISAIEYTEERSKNYSASNVYLKNKDGCFVVYSSVSKLPLINKINDGIELFHNNGTTATLINQWFTEE